MTYLVIDNLHVSETSRFNALLLQIILLHKERPLGRRSAGLVQLGPRLKERRNLGVGGGAVVAEEVHIGLAGLDPAARSAAAVGLLEDGVPISDGAKQVADVDEVKVVILPGPGLSSIIDLELNVGRNP